MQCIKTKKVRLKNYFQEIISIKIKTECNVQYYYVTNLFTVQETVHDYFIFYAFSRATLVFTL